MIYTVYECDVCDPLVCPLGETRRSNIRTTKAKKLGTSESDLLIVAILFYVETVAFHIGDYLLNKRVEENIFSHISCAPTKISFVRSLSRGVLIFAVR